MDKKIRKVEVNWRTLDNILKFEPEYDEVADTYILLSKENRPAISIDCDGEYWVRVDPQNGEILGIEIENFKRVFLKKHAHDFRRQTTYVRPIADLIQLEKCPA